MNYLKKYEELNINTYLNTAHKLDKLGYNKRAYDIRAWGVDKWIRKKFENIYPLDKIEGINPDRAIFFISDDLNGINICFAYYNFNKKLYFEIDNNRFNLYDTLWNIDFSDIEIKNLIKKYFNEYFPQYEVREVMDFYLEHYQRFITPEVIDNHNKNKIKRSNEELDNSTYSSAVKQFKKLGYVNRANDIAVHVLKRHLNSINYFDDIEIEKDNMTHNDRNYKRWKFYKNGLCIMQQNTKDKRILIDSNELRIMTPDNFSTSSLRRAIRDVFTEQFGFKIYDIVRIKGLTEFYKDND